MATKQFALPLDASSKQSGDINFKKLIDNGVQVEFKLTNVTGGAVNQLNLITSKGDNTIDHVFAASINAGSESTVLSHSQLSAVYADATDGDWDYIEAKWTAGSVDAQNPSNMFMIQGAKTYDYVGWPPNK